MKALQRLWQTITNNGIDEQAMGKAIVNIRLINQLIFIALVTSLLALTTYISTNESITIIYTTFGNLITESLGIYFAYQKKHHITQFLTCWIFPTLIGINVVILGGNFGEVNIFTALAFTNFIVYEDNKRLQIAAVSYTTLFFILSKLYIITYHTESIIQKNPYDEIITFPMILLALGLIILLYQKSLKQYETQQAILIQDLEEKNKTLSQVNDELEEFTYIASHDLKNPLRSISNHLDLIRIHLKKNNSKGIEQSVDLAKEGTKQIHALVRDILEYREITKLEKSDEIVDLNEVVFEILNAFRSEEKIATAEIYCQNLLPIKGRKVDFRILFENLIDNGITYNIAKKPTVWIESEVNENEVILTFKDNGIGIEKEFHEKIFQFFKRLHTQEKYEGTGIGLGLCKKIIQNYKGEILLKSQKDKGSIFKIILPKNHFKIA
jgi:signal transduction histidine kinase